MSNPVRSHALTLLAMCVLMACKPASTPATDTAAAATPAPAAAATPATDARSTIARVADSLDPMQNPKDAIKAAMDKFLALHSYHASMEAQGGARAAMGRSEIDFVAPDRYRMQMPMGTQIIIGDTMYMHAGGRTMKVPMPAGTLSQWRDPAKLQEAEAGMTVTAQGNDAIDGIAAKKYRIHHEQPKPVDMTMWINGDNLPVRIQVDNLVKGSNRSTTINYSRFDDPSLRIDPPQ